MKKVITLLIFSILCVKSYSQNTELKPNEPIRVKVNGSTTGVFGTSNTGISLQQNWPTIGFNQYRDASNVQRYIGTGYAMSNFFDPTTGTMYWNAIGTGTAGSATPSETNMMMLSRHGSLAPKSLEAPSTGLSLSGGNDISQIVSNVSDDGSLNIYSNSGGLFILGGAFLALDRNSIQARFKSFSFPGGTTKSNSNLRLNPFGGRVGINSGNTTISADLDVHRSPGNHNGTAIFRGTTHVSHFNYGNLEDTYVRGGKNGSHVIINDGALGNVGIGVYPNTYKLEVNGTARTKEVIVETGWADYVFEEDYKLKSIDELEAFVKENKHLPNIPKASEIEKNGLKVGETNKAMMEKIEELALYIIQLKKEIDILKAKN